MSFYVSTAGREAALNLAFNLSGGPGSESNAGAIPVAVAPTGDSSLSAVLNQATSGSVQQVSQLLSFTGTTLDLAATLLTVSVLPEGYESGSGVAVVGAAASVGLGQPAGQPGGNGGPGGAGEEAGEQAEGATTGAPPAVRAPRWEQWSIGLERAWEWARTAIRELEAQLADGGEPQADNRAGGQPALQANGCCTDEARYAGRE